MHPLFTPDALDGISRMDETRDHLGEMTIGRVDADQYGKEEGGAPTGGGEASVGKSDSGGSSTGGGPGQGGNSGKGHSPGGEGDY